jgi:hypothetical protein
VSDYLLVVLIAGGVALLVFFGVFALYMEHRRRPQRHGFEVKLNAGEEPVLKKEREDDHG